MSLALEIENNAAQLDCSLELIMPRKIFAWGILSGKGKRTIFLQNHLKIPHKTDFFLKIPKSFYKSPDHLKKNPAFCV